jgi:hypothetical protein
MRSMTSQRIPPIAKVMASGLGLFAFIALVSAAAWSEMREPALALCIGAASQLAIWTSVPMARAGMPPRALVALEVGIGVGSTVAAAYVSAWFVLAAVIALASAASLGWARRIGPTAAPPEAVTATEAPPLARKSMEELRAARPGMHRFFVVSIACNLILAALFAVAATAEPLMLVMTALFAGLAGAVRIAAWAWVKTTPPSVRRRFERSRRERQAAG